MTYVASPFDFFLHHRQLPPWIRSFDLLRPRRIDIVSWGVHDLFFLEVCSWGRVSRVWCCPFFQDGWSSFVCIWVSVFLDNHNKTAVTRGTACMLWNQKVHYLFHGCTAYLDNIVFFIYATDAQLDCSKIMSKFNVNLDIILEQSNCASVA